MNVNNVLINTLLMGRASVEVVGGGVCSVNRRDSVCCANKVTLLSKMEIYNVSHVFKTVENVSKTILQYVYNVTITISF